MSHIGEVYIFTLHEFVRNVENMNEINNITDVAKEAFCKTICGEYRRDCKVCTLIKTFTGFIEKINNESHSRQTKRKQ